MEIRTPNDIIANAMGQPCTCMWEGKPAPGQIVGVEFKADGTVAFRAEATIDFNGQKLPDVSFKLAPAGEATVKWTLKEEAQ